ncbi:hypothetical protein QA601_18515 [Chitinispirillales bacterium ANBcel5]|uniref:hypothetical protein n=1 Tax=Cellulosispirillum alkaliphilum TaxID=3039283 RepID=UPI002A521B4E|nr:hypothetical protein [Chitinispirillales bacterium ANBcel5]
MEIRIFYCLILVITLPSIICSQVGEKQSFLEINDTNNYVKDTIVKKQKNYNECYKKEYEKRSDKGEIFYYSDIVIGFKDTIKHRDNITFLNFTTISTSLNKTFEIGTLPGIGELDFWYFRCMKSKVFLIELDDYYSSIFFIYRYQNGRLYGLGDFTIYQPNVEDEGLKEKNIEVKIKEGSMEITTFLDDEKDNKYNFEFKNATELELIQ